MIATSPKSPTPPDTQATLFDTLGPANRLALAYAPRVARVPTLALFALDARLAGVLRHSHEPMLAQIRFAWWRETLIQSPESWPSGEPLLALLRSWGAEVRSLVALVDGWEGLTGHAPLAATALERMADGRGAAFAALARVLDRPGEAEAAERIGRRWALADLALHLRDRREVDAVQVLRGGPTAGAASLSRVLRPLAVLEKLTSRRCLRRQAGAEDEAAITPLDLLAALRIGVLGR